MDGNDRGGPGIKISLNRQKDFQHVERRGAILREKVTTTMVKGFGGLGKQ